MDSKEIREIIELISRSCFSTFELEGEGFRLKLVKDAADAPVVSGSVPVPVSAAETAPQQTVAAAPPAAPVAEPTSGTPQSDLIQLRSPIVGTFYRAASPSHPPFVEIGARVKKGQTVCIVEAMKVMNEIEAEADGEVVDIVVSNGQPVEFGEVLFLLKPLG